MGSKDITEKNLEALNDVFADIVNVLLFKGARLVNEKDLETDTAKSMFKADGKVHEQERDVSKFWKNGKIKLSILGLENQTKPDNDMPLRVISYDGASYKQQLLDKTQTKRYPVVTLVLYFETKEKWNSNKCLFDCFGDFPEQLTPYVNNYKINVCNVAWLSEKQINLFTSDFKYIAEYLRAKRLKKRYTGSKEKIRHVNETLKLFTALTGDDSFEKVYNEGNFKKGGIAMCDVVERIKDEGRKAGIAEGRTEERIEIIRKMLDSKMATPEQVANLFKISVKEVKKISETVPVLK